MKLKTEKVLNLMNEHASGNFYRFARQLRVDPAHLHKCITHGSFGGKLIGTVKRYCEIKGINYEEYIEL